MQADQILNHRLIGERYFFPQRMPLPQCYAVEVPGASLGCWRSAPPSDRPVLVHFHGNGELVHHWIADFAPIIQSWGYDVFLSEYRGYGASTGQPRIAAMLDDLDAIAEAIQVPASQIVVFGRSVGSLFAIEWVHRFPQCRGLVLESGIHDVLERLSLRVSPAELGCTPAELHAAVQARLNHTRKLNAYTGPSLVLHAQQDHLVDITHGERNHAAAGGKDKTFVAFEHGDHNSIMFANQTRYFGELSNFLKRLLG
jgi:pimeloyl-ACP methyl ester carboxylesterase